jgi:FkbM family methyltransferase
MNILTELIGFYRSRIIYDLRPFKQRKMIRLYSQFIQKDNICFDIGAHTGSRTKAFLKIGAKVIAMEPNPKFNELLSRKFSCNPNLKVLRDAISSNLGSARFMISLKYPSISTLSLQWKNVMLGYQSNVKWEKEILVNTVTLDELIKNFGMPVFCKIDVEGYEEEALNGLSKAIPTLSFEFFPTTSDRTKKCIERLSKLGTYEFNWSITESFTYISKKWLTKEKMIEEIENYRKKKSGDIYANLLHP